VGSLVDVDGADEEQVGRQEHLVVRRQLDGGGAVAGAQFHCGEKAGEVVLHPRQVHLVQHKVERARRALPLAGVQVLGGSGAKEAAERGVVVLTVQRVHVSQQILVRGPVGRHGNHQVPRPHGTSVCFGQPGLAGAAHAREYHESARPQRQVVAPQRPLVYADALPPDGGHDLVPGWRGVGRLLLEGFHDGRDGSGCLVGSVSIAWVLRPDLRSSPTLQRETRV
jgi:hypothetical protein